MVRKHMKQQGSRKKSLTDWARVDAMQDEDIDYSEIPELGEEFWKNAKVVFPARKKMLSIRLDEDVVEWFKAQGQGYQSRINAVLGVCQKISGNCRQDQGVGHEYCRGIRGHG
jgi:uncharacterized protein (DUF4415 family)